MKFLRNVGIKKSIPLLFSKLVEDINLNGIGDSDKSSLVQFLEDEYWSMYTMKKLELSSSTRNW